MQANERNVFEKGLKMDENQFANEQKMLEMAYGHENNACERPLRERGHCHE